MRQFEQSEPVIAEPEEADLEKAFERTENLGHSFGKVSPVQRQASEPPEEPSHRELPPGCINEHHESVVVKPEEAGRSIFELGPGQTYSGAIDGVKPPAWGGDWLKVLTNSPTVIITPDGLPTGHYRDAGILSVFDFLPGRKKEPGWSRAHPDWAVPVLVDTPPPRRSSEPMVG